MREFMETISAETYPQPTPFPMRNNKGDWADYGTDLDTLWKTLVANEPKLAPGEEVEGFDPDQKLLVKPWETAHAPVAVLTTCSPAMTLHEHYGSVRDVNNESTARLLLKLGHYFPGMQSKPLFMAHLFPRRIHELKSGSLSDPLKSLRRCPRKLVDYWTSQIFDMWLRSSAKVAIIMGHVPRNVYVDYIETSGITYEPIISAGRIWGYLELQEHAISRIVVFQDHVDYIKQFGTHGLQFSELQRV
jgi:hypothetical protein